MTIPCVAHMWRHIKVSLPSDGLKLSVPERPGRKPFKVKKWGLSETRPKCLLRYEFYGRHLRLYWLHRGFIFQQIAGRLKHRTPETKPVCIAAPVDSPRGQTDRSIPTPHLLPLNQWLKYGTEVSHFCSGATSGRRPFKRSPIRSAPQPSGLAQVV